MEGMSMMEMMGTEMRMEIGMEMIKLTANETAERKEGTAGEGWLWGRQGEGTGAGWMRSRHGDDGGNWECVRGWMRRRFAPPPRPPNLASS